VYGKRSCIREKRKSICNLFYFLFAAGHKDKVPKWSRAAFQDKFNIMKGKLDRGKKEDSDGRFADVDASLARLQRKLREGSALETGQRGANRVSALAEGLFPDAGGNKEENAPPKKTSLSSQTSAPSLSKSSSECCHFCGKRVYVVERMSAEGKFFHRSCFRCDYCGILLRLGSYVFHREGPFESKKTFLLC